MSGADLTRAAWRISTRSMANEQCVEVAGVSGAVAVRDSKDRNGPVLLIDAERWAVFLAGIRDGEFDGR